MSNGKPWPKGRRGPNWRPIAPRFWAKVEKRRADECWPWKGSRDHGGRGYGRISRTDQVADSRLFAAHRVSWELHHGAIPRGRLVLHRCDNRACVNPRHLFLGTQRDNVADAWSKRRGRNTVRLGERNPAAKLTDDQVVEARRLMAEGRPTQEVASLFGVSRAHMWAIRAGKTRAHTAAAGRT